MTKQELEKEILRHRNLYYNHQAEISDREYDKLEDELRKIEPRHPLLLGIGSDTSEGFTKREHMMKMGSQDKLNSEDDLRQWLRIKSIKFPLVIEHKLDGLSLECQYVQSHLIATVSRGNGIFGDNLSLEHTMKIGGIVKELRDENVTCAVRGEVIMLNETFERKYAPQGFKNSRNAASGILHRLDGEGYEDLVFITYDTNATRGIQQEEDKLDFLDVNRFNRVYCDVVSTYEELQETLIREEQRRKELSYIIDGLVIKQNMLDIDDTQRLRPEYQRAYKFENEDAETILTGIEWSRSGFIYTPVALFTPIELGGATISRASLANYDEVKRLGLKIGDSILVARQNDVIPKVIEVSESLGTEDIIPPKTCEICGKELIITGARVYCGNESCKSYVEHRLYKWIKQLDVKGFGDALISYILTLKSYKDIYSLYTEELYKEAITGTNLVKATQRAFENLYKIKEIGLSDFLAGLDIDGIGEKQWRKVVEAGYDSLYMIEEAQLDELMAIKGIGDVLAPAMMQGLRDVHDVAVKILETNKIFLQQENTTKTTTLTSSLINKSFCFTGSLNTMKRGEAEALVMSKGGKIASVSKNLTYLVTNDKESGSAKNVKAQNLGVKLINEQEFLEMMR